MLSLEVEVEIERRDSDNSAHRKSCNRLVVCEEVRDTPAVQSLPHKPLHLCYKLRLGERGVLGESSHCWKVQETKEEIDRGVCLIG